MIKKCISNFFCQFTPTLTEFIQGYLCKCKDEYHSPNTNSSLGSQYESVGEPCEFIPEINECDGVHDCHANATCSDTRFKKI